MSCDGCPVGEAIERREFVRDLLAAFALPVTFASGFGVRTDKAYALPAADGVVIDKGESVIIARFDSKVFAFSLACPHQNTALKWDAKAGRFQCPKHKSRYKPDGVFIDGRATRGLDRFAVRRDGDKLMVNLDALYEEDKNAEWKAAFVQL
jgi:Rieske Fe-S protein